MVAAHKLETTLEVTPRESTLIAEQPLLKKTLAMLNRIADRKSTMPMLSCILVTTSCKVTVGETTFTATDLNTWLRVTAPTWGRSNGSMLIRGKALADVVGKMPKKLDVTLAASGRMAASVMCGSASVTVEGFQTQDFPRFPEPNDPAWSSIDADALASLFKRTDYSTCRDETRFHLAGTFIEADGKRVRAVTTDGHRLTRATAPIKGWAIPKGVIVPRKFAIEAARLLVPGECEISIAEPTTLKGLRMLYLRQGGWLLVTKLIDAQFPPYEQVIPQDHRKLVTVDRVALLDAIERAKVTCSLTRGVKLSCDDGQLKISADNGEGAESTEWLPAEHQGGTVAIGFNPQYVAEVLSALHGERVTIALGNELDPAVVRCTDDVVTNSLAESPYLGVLMPMRI